MAQDLGSAILAGIQGAQAMGQQRIRNQLAQDELAQGERRIGLLQRQVAVDEDTNRRAVEEANRLNTIRDNDKLVQGLNAAGFLTKNMLSIDGDKLGRGISSGDRTAIRIGLDLVNRSGELPPGSLAEAIQPLPGGGYAITVRNKDGSRGAVTRDGSSNPDSEVVNFDARTLANLGNLYYQTQVVSNSSLISPTIFRAQQQRVVTDAERNNELDRIDRKNTILNSLPVAGGARRSAASVLASGSTPDEENQILDRLEADLVNAGAIQPRSNQAPVVSSAQRTAPSTGQPPPPESSVTERAYSRVKSDAAALEAVGNGMNKNELMNLYMYSLRQGDLDAASRLEPYLSRRHGMTQREIGSLRKQMANVRLATGETDTLLSDISGAVTTAASNAAYAIGFGERAAKDRADRQAAILNDIRGTPSATSSAVPARGSGAPSATSDSARAGSSPAGKSVRNNNPGNLRFANQRGSTGKDETGFAIFPTREAGLVALEKQIRLDIGRGDTLQKFISEYAPAADKNDPIKYTDFVSKATGIRPDEKIPVSKIPVLMAAIVQMEGGDSASSYFALNKTNGAAITIQDRGVRTEVRDISAAVSGRSNNAVDRDINAGRITVSPAVATAVSENLQSQGINDVRGLLRLNDIDRAMARAVILATEKDPTIRKQMSEEMSNIFETGNVSISRQQFDAAEIERDRNDIARAQTVINQGTLNTRIAELRRDLFKDVDEKRRTAVDLGAKFIASANEIYFGKDGSEMNLNAATASRFTNSIMAPFLYRAIQAPTKAEGQAALTAMSPALSTTVAALAAEEKGGFIETLVSFFRADAADTVSSTDFDLARVRVEKDGNGRPTRFYYTNERGAPVSEAVNAKDLQDLNGQVYKLVLDAANYNSRGR
jgi:hypothetical protein